MVEWQKVIFAGDCDPCDMCGEPVCPVCSMHYAECPCPGPHEDEIFDYKEVDQILYARIRDDLGLEDMPVQGTA